MGLNINEKDLLALLNGGTDAQDIADEFAALLNGAIATSKREEENKKAREASKRAKFAELRDLLANLVKEFYPDMYTSDLNTLDVNVLIEACDKAYEEVQALMPELDELERILGVKAPIVATKPTAPKVEEVKVDNIEKFLRDMGLK